MRKGLALVDIVREVTMYGTKENVFFILCSFILILILRCTFRFVFKIKMPPTIRVQLINDLADIEYELFLWCLI